MTDDKIVQANTFNEEGKRQFKAKHFESAIKSFTKAIELAPEDERYFANRSAAHAKLLQWKESAEDAKQCVVLKPEWVKGYVRQANALHALKEYEEAVQVCLAGLQKDPSAQALSKQMALSQKALQKKEEDGGVEDDGLVDEDEEKSNGLVVGIDLGTTNSCVAVWRGDSVEIIPNTRGEMTTPSYVAWTNTGQRLVGVGARNQQARNPENTVFDVKRFIGQGWEHEGVQQDSRNMPYKILPDEKGSPVIEVIVDGKNKKQQFSPPEISAMVLEYMKHQAEQYLEQKIDRAVITVPAYFNDAQRQATQLAGRIAGLEVLRIINEPTAAALSYGLDLKKMEAKNNVLIFDLGGGTFDVSILTIENGIFDVKATGGDTRLGGEDFDQRTLEFLLQEAEKQGIPDLSKDKNSLKRIRVEAEKAKRLLSQAQSAPILIEKLGKGTGKHKKGYTFKYTLTRDQFERANQALFNRCLDVVKRVMRDAGIPQKEIHDVVLVGGSTRIPKLQQMLTDYFGIELCKALNPDEAVAYGAAVQAAILNGQRSEATKSILLRDVTPLSLGIETTGGVMSVVVPRNTPIPCVKTGVYTTEENYQTEIEIPVYEGERLKTANNHFLGQFSITDIEKAKRGEPKILVSFEIDSNGVLKVSAKDQKTGAAAETQIESRSQLSENEVQRMVQEAALFRKKDEANLMRTEAQLQLETAIATAEEVLEGLANAKIAARLEAALRTATQVLAEADDDTKTSKFISARTTLERLLDRAAQF